MNTPLITVVIPAYNAAGTLAETLDSVLAQTYRNIEVLVVDDGSTDATAAIARDYARRDARVFLLEKANGGVASARNHGLAAARGDYVAPVDADDLWHPAKLDRQMAVMLAGGPDLGLVYTLFRAIDEQGDILWTQPRFTCEGRVLARHVYVNFIGQGSSLLMRRGAALQAGAYDPTLRDAGAQGCEDYLLQLRIARRYRFGCVPEYLVGYRQVAGSMSSQAGRMRRSYQLMLGKIRAESPDLPAVLFRWSLANYQAVMAPTLVRSGKLMQGLAFLGRAALSDPLAVLDRFFLSPYGHRFIKICLGEMLRGVGSERAGGLPRPHFLDADPVDLDRKGPGGLLERRLRRLAFVDLDPGPVGCGASGPAAASPPARP